MRALNLILFIGTFYKKLNIHSQKITKIDAKEQLIKSAALSSW